MTLEQALHYIHAVCWKGSIPGLERIEALLDKMGHPERACKFVHVAGTNGKGSTCAMLASIFQAAGYKTGLYTSPYILRFNERIQVNGQQIPDIPIFHAVRCCVTICSAERTISAIGRSITVFNPRSSFFGRA